MSADAPWESAADRSHALKVQWLRDSEALWAAAAEGPEALEEFERAYRQRLTAEIQVARGGDPAVGQPPGGAEGP